jgi:hypothetical protein
MPLESFLADAELQAIAAENNLAEPAFIVLDAMRKPEGWSLIAGWLLARCISVAKRLKSKHSRAERQGYWRNTIASRIELGTPIGPQSSRRSLAHARLQSFERTLVPLNFICLPRQRPNSMRSEAAEIPLIASHSFDAELALNPPRKKRLRALAGAR